MSFVLFIWREEFICINKSLCFRWKLGAECLLGNVGFFFSFYDKEHFTVTSEFTDERKKKNSLIFRAVAEFIK